MKPKLLLLHGALGSKKQFESLKTVLKDKFDIYDFNFEGHGGVKSDKDFSIQLFTDNVVDFMTNNKLEKTHIFGYSMGGYVALNTAYQYPEKVNKIVTLGTKFNWDTISTRKEVAMLNPEKIEEKVPNYGQKLHSEHFPLDWKTVVKKTASMMIALSEGKCLKNDNFVQLYHEVVIGIGNLDKMVSYDESKLISSLLPNGKLVTLDGVPHPIDKIDVEKLALYIQNSC